VPILKMLEHVFVSCAPKISFFDYPLALPGVTGGRESRTIHDKGDIDEGNVSGEQKENFDRCPATGPDEGDLPRQRQ
jgi:hypothetical protein